MKWRHFRYGSKGLARERNEPRADNRRRGDNILKRVLRPLLGKLGIQKAGAHTFQLSSRG